MKHTAFFGDGEKTFALTTPMILELERKTGHGILALFNRLQHRQAAFKDITETIRCALIGGGTTPQEAADLTWTYAENRPLGESLAVALGILDMLFFGPDEPEAIAEPPKATPAEELRANIARALADDVTEAAATGDLSAALNEAAHG